MNKPALILACLSLLTSCSNSAGSQTEPPSSEPSSSQSSAVSTYLFDKETDALLVESIGEEGMKSLPAPFEGASYNGENRIDSSSGITYTSIKVYLPSPSQKEAELYAKALLTYSFAKSETASGYSLSKIATDTEYLVVDLIQYSGENGLAMGMNVYLSPYRYAAWPEEKITAFLGWEIPYPEGDYYYLSSSSSEDLLIQVEGGVSASSADDYASALKEEGYEVTSYLSYGITVYAATPKQGGFTISFAYDEETSCLLIRLTH